MPFPPSDATIADKLKAVHETITIQIQSIFDMTNDELQSIIDSASIDVKFDDFASKLTAIDEKDDNDGKVTISQLLEVLNSLDCPKINSLLLGWVQMMDEPCGITEIQNFMSTKVKPYIASIKQMIEDHTSDMTATVVDVYCDGLQQFQSEILSDYTVCPWRDSALGEVNKQDGLIDIGDVDVNVFDNDGDLSIDSFDAQTDLAPVLDALPVKPVHHSHHHKPVDLQLVIGGLGALVLILIFVILCLVFGRCSCRSAVKYTKTLQSNPEQDDIQSEDDELIA